MDKEIREIHRAKAIQKKKLDLLESREWYLLQSILGNDWAMFYLLLGGREVGKSYSVTDFCVGQWKKYKRPFYWLRLTEGSASKLLMNNSEKLVDPDLRRKYHLETKTSGGNIYDVSNKKKRLMARVLALNTFYNDKGSGLFDKDFLDDPNMYYNIVLDEMNREKNERKTFDIVYAFVNQIENIIRSTKKRVRIIMIGNTLEEASDLLCCFNFIPNTFGRYYLHSKRAVIDYIKPSEAYLKRRKGTVADLLTPTASTFTNECITDSSLIYTGRLQAPARIIKFSKDPNDWFTVWDSNIIAQYHKEKKPSIAMRPYIDDKFFPELQQQVYMLYDARAYRFKNLLTQKEFTKNLALLKPRNS